MNNKHFTTIILAMLALIIGACTSNVQAPPPTPTPDEMVTIQLAMGYIPDIQFAPFYVADQQGYFAEEGIQIVFVPMFENESIPLVGAGEMKFAIASAEQVLLARSQGLPVVYVAKWWEQYPVAVAAKTESDIATPADLAGRTVGLPGLYGANYIGIRALLDSQGIPETDLTLEAIDYTQVQSLAADTVEAVVVYANNEPFQLAAAGYEINVINIADHVNLASNGLVTNEATIAGQPELVRGMARAMLRGLADVIADPEAAYAASLKYVDTLNEGDAVQQQVLQASIEMWQTGQPGVSDMAAWESMQGVLLNMELLTEPVDLAAAFTNDFLP